MLVTCPTCGRSLAASSTIGGLCPACLLALAAEPGGADATASPDPDAACQVIGLLGSGQHSRSYLAEWTRDGRRAHVVLKTIDVEAPPDFTARASIERRRLDALALAGVARLFDAGLTAAGQPYFVYEYVRGLPLTTHCAQFALDRAARRSLVDAVGGRLDAVHAAGLAHGAIKPANVLVAGTPGAWQPVLLDLGVRSLLAPALAAGDDADDFATLAAAIE